ncbi:MAG: TlpA family protein disulfide reductase [Acidobacteriota bacterium]|nr:TlpA family protein disulfide reductase [Acidobacteriota bacterium]
MPVKRNTVVLGITLFLLAAFAWAGWANWEYRKQQAAKVKAMSAQQGILMAAADGTLQYKSPLMDKPAPAFTLQNLKGQKVSLADYKGKALLINFWATWCGPCKLETPWLVELRNQYASKGFEVLGVSAEGDDYTPADKAGWAKDKDAIQQFVAKNKVPYPVLMGGDSIAAAYGGVDAMPTSFYVDRSGKIVATQMGITSKDEIESKIQKALAD